MGYGEYGGGGSVKWKIDVDDETKRGEKRVSAFGRDAKKTTNFRVSLEYPTMAAAKRDLERLKKDGLTVRGNKIIFEVPVQPLNEDQIRVEW